MEIDYVYFLVFFLAASALFYIVLGGADYGAGILELLPSHDFKQPQKKLINYAMGPVWEANHIWLILIVVILFMGFPPIFTTLVTSLHIPFVCLLVGVVIRGAAFSFRYYDAVKDEKSQRLYTQMFGFSSLWTSIWLGVIAGSLYRGHIEMAPTSFVEAYVDSWLGLFPFSVGIFCACIFAFLASINLVGETEDSKLQAIYQKRAFVFNVLTVVTGGLVFVASYLEGENLVERFFTSSFSVVCMVLATACFGALWVSSKKPGIWTTRVIAGAQCAFILAGWYDVYFPDALVTTTGTMTFFEHAAPDATLRQLCLALAVGSLMIFPSLFYLFHIFKGHQGKN